MATVPLRPCEVDPQLSNYSASFFQRYITTEVAILNGTIQRNTTGGRVMCTFDEPVYDYFDELLLINTTAISPNLKYDIAEKDYLPQTTI